MAFKFRLEKVLHHRKSLEDFARKNFLEAQADLLEAQNILTGYYQDIERSQQDRQAIILNENQQSDRLRQIHDYIKGTEIKIERQKLVVREKMSKVEEMQLALQEASIEYKMIEKLKERQQEDYRLSEKKLEEKELTEMTNSRFNLRQKNE
jgi:flagellar FliJ protein